MKDSASLRFLRQARGDSTWFKDPTKSRNKDLPRLFRLFLIFASNGRPWCSTATANV